MPFVFLLVAVLVTAGIVAFLRWQRPAATSVEPKEKETAMSTESVASADSEVAAEEPTAEPASELARMFQDGEVHSIRLVGDSITAGYGTDGYNGPDVTGEGRVIYDDGEGDVHYETSEAAVCWANEFRAYASERGVTDFVNAGINGAFMSRLAEHPDAWLGEGADVVFVALGTNDAGYYGPEEYRAYAEAGLGAAADKSKLVVVLSPVSDLRPESQLVEPAASLVDVLREICDEHGYVLVNLGDAVAPEQFNADGLHPTSEGSLAIWECIQTTLGL